MVRIIPALVNCAVKAYSDLGIELFIRPKSGTVFLVQSIGDTFVCEADSSANGACGDRIGTRTPVTAKNGGK